MKLYHRTTEQKARAIIKDGFKDQEGNYLTDTRHMGVWVSNVPLDPNEGATGDTLLEMTIPECVVRSFEWIEEGKPYREFLVPAAILNGFKIKRTRP
jgi:hypothetical protein